MHPAGWREGRRMMNSTRTLSGFPNGRRFWLFPLQTFQSALVLTGKRSHFPGSVTAKLAGSPCRLRAVPQGVQVFEGFHLLPRRSVQNRPTRVDPGQHSLYSAERRPCTPEAQESMMSME
jgi:hypothetical protein